MIQCTAPIISSKPAHTVHVHTVLYLYTVTHAFKFCIIYIQCMYVVDQVIVYSVAHREYPIPREGLH